MDPSYVSLHDIPGEIWQAEKERFEKEAQSLGKPERIQKDIVDGKLNAYFGARTLLMQPFVKDEEKTVEAVLNEAIGRFGENIKIGKFVRFEI